MKKVSIYLFALVLGAYSIMDARQQNNQRSSRSVAKQPVQQQVVQEVVEQDSHNVVVNERPLKKGEVVHPKVDITEEKQKDGSVTKIITSVEQQGDKVVTKTETWTNYAKYAAIGLGAAGLATAGWYGYKDQIADKFKELQDWWNGSRTSEISKENNQKIFEEKLTVAAQKAFPHNVQWQNKLIEECKKAMTLEALQASLSEEDLQKLKDSKININALMPKIIAKFDADSMVSEMSKAGIKDNIMAFKANAKHLFPNDKQAQEKYLSSLTEFTPETLATLEILTENHDLLTNFQTLFELPQLKEYKQKYQQEILDAKTAGFWDKILLTMLGADIVASAVIGSNPLWATSSAAAFMAKNVDPVTAQASMDETDKNIDAQELYQ